MAEKHNAPPSGQPDNPAAENMSEIEAAFAADFGSTSATADTQQPSDEHPLSKEERAEKLRETLRKNRGREDSPPIYEKNEGEIDMGEKSFPWKWVLVVLVLVFGLLFGIGKFSQTDDDANMTATVPTQETSKAKVVPVVNNDSRVVVAALNSMSDEIGGLKKEIAELKVMVAEVKECACKKPAKRPVKKVVPKPAPKPAPAVAPPAPAPFTPAPKVEQKADCAPSAPKPAIIRPGHMPLGALPSASCPNCK